MDDEIDIGNFSNLDGLDSTERYELILNKNIVFINASWRIG